MQRKQIAEDGVLSKIRRDPLRALLVVVEKLGVFSFYNKLVQGRMRRRTFSQTGLQELDEIIEYSSEKKSSISDHLLTIFLESLSVKPNVIVELGVGSGHSTFVLQRVAKLCGSKLISVDIEDCSHVCSYSEQVFIQKDDIEFAKEFESWCERAGIEPKIDVLFIDTSHTLTHTLQEIESWFQFLSEECKVFFHDTNIKHLYFRKDGSIGLGWDNRRGVIKALEKFFNRRFNEKEDFIDFCNGWLIKHHSCCNGLAILQRMGSFSRGDARWL